MKMPVSSSHLALRFYKHAGWTREILELYLVSGRILDVWENQPVRDYWFLDHSMSSRFDMGKLYTEQISVVVRYSDTAESNKSDLEYLEGLNG